MIVGYPPEMDAQHEHLFDLCDQLRALLFPVAPDATMEAERGTASSAHRAIRMADAVPVSDEVKVIASAFLHASVEHFGYEDRLMMTTRSKLLGLTTTWGDDYDRHVLAHHGEHEAFISNRIVHDTLHEHHRVSAMGFYVYTRHWLMSHIGRMDKELGQWCRYADGLPASPPMT